MNWLRNFALLSLFSCLISSTLVAESPPNAKPVFGPVSAIRDPGKITHVTVYRDRALVTRELRFTVTDADQVITIDNIPESLISGSVFAEIEGDGLVRAVQVSREFRETPESDELETARNELEEKMKQESLLRMKVKVLEENEQVVKDLINFSAESGRSDLNRGVINAEELKQLALFAMEQRTGMSEQKHTLSAEVTTLQHEIKNLGARIAQLDQHQGDIEYEARVFLEAAAGTELVIRLKYHVSGCSWSPRYTVRADSANSSLGLRFGAEINQATGESWNDVQLILSAASPMSEAARPVLTPLRVTSTFPDDLVKENEESNDPFEDGAASDIDFDEELARLTNLLRQHRQEGPQSSARSERDIQLNRLAGQLQQIELQARSRTLRSMAIDASDDLFSQTYQLEKPVTLDSRNDLQLIQIVDANVPATLYHVATPLLNSFAYRQARFTNDFEFGLLSGPASIYLDDRFVGQLKIPATARGQKLTLGLGPDPQVRTRRELLEKTDKIQGGNRQIQFDFRLVVTNMKESPIELRLLDRIPVATEAEQISVGFVSEEHELSEDAIYQRTLKPLGIMRWDLEIPANRIGADAVDVHYSSTLEFDRNKVPTTRHSIEEILADYEESINRGGGFGGGGIF